MPRTTYSKLAFIAALLVATDVDAFSQNAALYALNHNSGTISVYTIATDGGLSPIAGSPFSSGGTSPEGMAFDPSGPFTYVSNGNNIAGFMVNPSGALTPIAGSPFATARGALHVTIDPAGRFLYACDQPSAGISVFTIDPSTGSLSPVAGSPFTATLGVGPWDLAVDPSGQFLYVTNSYGNGLSGFAINSSTGGLTPLSGSPMGGGMLLPVRTSGSLLFTTYGLSGLLESFVIGAGGSLTAAPGSPYIVGTLAQGLAVDPAGRFVYATSLTHNSVSGFAITANGALNPVSGSPVGSSDGPFGATTDPSGRFLYVGDVFANSISGYAITQSGSSAGALTPLAASPFASGLYPAFVAAHSLPGTQGIAVPALSNWALLVLAVLLIAAALLGRRRVESPLQ